MPFSVKSNKTGETYYLHATTTKGGSRTLHYFAKQVKDGALDALPDGYEPSESKTGMPVLKKKVEADHAAHG